MVMSTAFLDDGTSDLFFTGSTYIQRVECRVSCTVWVFEAEKHNAYSLEACYVKRQAILFSRSMEL